MKKRFLPSLGIAIALFGVLLLSATTHAVDQGSMIKKWVFTQFYNCIQNNINSPLERQDSGSVADSVFNGGELLLPSYNFGHSVGSNPISCRDLFKGTDNLQGVLDYAGMDKNTDWSSLEASDNFLKQLDFSTSYMPFQNILLQ